MFPRPTRQRHRTAAASSPQRRHHAAQRSGIDRLIDAHAHIARQLDLDHARTVRFWRTRWRRRRHSLVWRRDAYGEQTNFGTAPPGGSTTPSCPAPAINQADANAIALGNFAQCAARSGTRRQHFGAKCVVMSTPAIRDNLNTRRCLAISGCHCGSQTVASLHACHMRENRRQRLGGRHRRDTTQA